MLRLSELYPSVQGEGARVGIPTQFVRFAGCNLRCPGWPCDTPHAIDPAIWRHDSEKVRPRELFNRIQTIASRTGAENICYTGGEPFMQKYGELEELVNLVEEAGFQQEVFTNGTYPFPDWAIGRMRFMMDWKLTGSGESENHREERYDNAQRLDISDGIKFVVTNTEDIIEAIDVTTELHRLDVLAELWVAAAWGKIKDELIVDHILASKLPWRLNVQVHKYIYDPDKRGV